MDETSPPINFQAAAGSTYTLKSIVQLLLGGDSDVIDANDGTFDFSAGNVTIILDGTKLVNCTIIANQTTLVYQKITKTFIDCLFSGTFCCECLYPDLFGTNDTEATDDTYAMQQCFDVAVGCGIYLVRLLSRTYLIGDTLYYKGNFKFEGTFYGDNYSTVGSCILANLNESPLETNPDGNSSPNLKFALDSDCYYKIENNSLERIPVWMSASNKILCEQSGHSFISVPPIHINNIRFISTNNSFGAIRSMGMVNAKIEGLSISGFRVGMMFHKGWNFVVSRVQIRVSLLGLAMYNKITDGLLNSVQLTRQLLNDETDAQFSQAMQSHIVDGVEQNPYRKFLNTFVSGDSSYHDIYDNIVEEDNSIVESANRESIISKDLKIAERDAYAEEESSIEQVNTVAISANSTKIVFNSCSMERFDIGFIGWNDDVVFNNPYVEGLKQSIAFINNGYIWFNNMIGNQLQTHNFSYIALDFHSRIVLNNCHPGTFFPTFSLSYQDSEDRNKMKYNFKAYVVQNHNKIDKPLLYCASNYLDYDVGDTVFVAAENSENTDLINTRWGNFILQPISLDAAIERIANDYNYRHVRYIVLTTSMTLDETLTWASQLDEIIIMSSSQNNKITISARQDLKTNLTLKTFKVHLNTSFLRVYGKNRLNLVLNNITLTKATTDNDIYLIENSGVKPATECLCDCVLVNSSNLLPFSSIVSDDWAQDAFSTRFIIEHGTASLVVI